ncbi:MAG TPA: hypothetical protein VNW92_25235 [Polyangiaceae bacterium]|nr:hypothetical protein [Polyangiaceae bacterium]
MKPAKPLVAAWLTLLATSFSCSPRVTRIGTLDAGPGVYLEAEEGVLSGGFMIESDPKASAGRFITAAVGATSEDVPGPARAAYELNADVAGTYLIWGRIHDQNINQNRFFFQIDGGAWVKWRITTGDVWFWDTLHDNINYGTAHPFELSFGTHQLVIANCVDGAELDRLYYAADRSKPEGAATMCNPPHSVQLNGICNPSCGSLSGQCGGAPCVGLPTMATYDCPGCCIPAQ